jgi:hypothetical protein
MFNVVGCDVGLFCGGTGIPTDVILILLKQENLEL